MREGCTLIVPAKLDAEAMLSVLVRQLHQVRREVACRSRLAYVDDTEQHYQAHGCRQHRLHSYGLHSPLAFGIGISLLSILAKPENTRQHHTNRYCACSTFELVAQMIKVVPSDANDRNDAMDVSIEREKCCTVSQCYRSNHAVDEPTRCYSRLTTPAVDGCSTVKVGRCFYSQQWEPTKQTPEIRLTLCVPGTREHLHDDGFRDCERAVTGD